MYSLFAIPALSFILILAIALREVFAFTPAKPMREQIEEARQERVAQSEMYEDTVLALAD